MFLVGTDQMEAGKYISEHDKKIANKLAYVMAGGDLSEPTMVSEQYLLDLEREAFLSYVQKKTLEKSIYANQKRDHYVIKKIKRDAQTRNGKSDNLLVFFLFLSSKK
jgi:hypothetical protein